MKNKPKIIINKSAHGTIDVVLYDMPNINLVKWFEMIDIWGSQGYDRFNDGGLYFELPKEFYNIISIAPFVKRYHIDVIKEES